MVHSKMLSAVYHPPLPLTGEELFINMKLTVRVKYKINYVKFKL